MTHQYTATVKIDLARKATQALVAYILSRDLVRLKYLVYTFDNKTI